MNQKDIDTFYSNLTKPKLKYMLLVKKGKVGFWFVHKEYFGTLESAEHQAKRYIYDGIYYAVAIGQLDEKHSNPPVFNHVYAKNTSVNKEYINKIKKEERLELIKKKLLSYKLSKKEKQ